MEIIDKLRILTGAAKYDVACTSSGSSRKGVKDGIGNTTPMGICHSFASDGRCISLLKILLTNYCIYDCAYCVNRSSNDVERAAFTADEIANLTINFYKRNYIEGLFLSSAVIKNPDYTMEQMCRALEILRYKHRFGGYIHAKAIPGASPRLIHHLGGLADRLSVNIELPSEEGLKLLAPQKTKKSIVEPMKQIATGIQQSTNDLVLYGKSEKFAPAGQSTQMIVGATNDTDYKILNLSAGLYKKFSLKRVFYSAYVPMGTNPNLPVISRPPLLREHRLYQADWLLRFYGFDAKEILTEDYPNFNPLLDPKCDWAIKNLHLFPVDVNTAPYEMLLRIPGVGVRSAMRIRTARKMSTLDFSDLKKLGIVLKRARYFITCKGKYLDNIPMTESFIMQNLVGDKSLIPHFDSSSQISFLDDPKISGFLTESGLKLPNQNEEVQKCLSGEF